MSESVVAPTGFLLQLLKIKKIYFAPTRISSYLREFIDTNKMYSDKLTEGKIEKIRDAADKEPDEIVPINVTKRRGNSRRSLVPQFHSEWASSKEAFRKAVWTFGHGHLSQSQNTGRNITAESSRKQPLSPSYC
ncbi:hypothetical protein OnM2_051078 [Erysiphe neolycopersici]|uniref:Uncharacterized protein n=1 Tax=Erysiphe neolycopersici TaxID=212602 RepID=A0A420HSI3_9PEZI|nr:hypothetical protein OnM2_051078 [Erysiphe neolycopersici]